MQYPLLSFCFLAGGETSNRELLPLVEVYNPVTNKTKQLSPMLTPRRSLGVVIVDNMIFAIGGSDGLSALCTVEVILFPCIIKYCEHVMLVLKCLFQLSCKAF